MPSLDQYGTVLPVSLSEGRAFAYLELGQTPGSGRAQALLDLFG